MRTERIAAVEDLRRLASSATGEAARASKEVADHVLLRVGLLVAGAILLWGALAYVGCEAAGFRARAAS